MAGNQITESKPLKGTVVLLLGCHEAGGFAPLCTPTWIYCLATGPKAMGPWAETSQTVR